MTEDFPKAQQRFFDELDLLSAGAAISFDKKLENLRRNAAAAAFSPDEIDSMVTEARRRAGRIVDFPGRPRRTTR